MNKLIYQLSNIPKGLENKIAIETSKDSITYAGLAERVKTLSFWLLKQNTHSVALHADNCIDWVVVDLACQMAQIILTPIPLFFTQTQYDQILVTVKPNILFSQQNINFAEPCECEQVSLNTYKIAQVKRIEAPRGTELINQLIQTNLVTPMLFTHEFLAKSKASNKYSSGTETLNVIQLGSAFGYIGYPGFSAYSASKFGLRGFTEALAREYSDTKIRFAYFAPRATNTGINTASVDDMNQALGNTMDSVDVVAKTFLTFLNSHKREQVVGWPEIFFARVNGLMPTLVDNAIESKLSIIKRYLQQSLPP
jgi:NAD(P)-dependent dehydrogenase (short-subunit alcohol dehydrogenase family)